MHAVMAILAALVRANHRRGRLPRRVGGRRGAGAHGAECRRVPGDGDEPGPGHGLLTGRYACYDTYECADGGWLAVAAIEPRFWANLCRALGLDKWTEQQTDDAVQDGVRAELRAAFATQDRDEWVDELGPADTCVGPVLSIPEVVDDAQFAGRGSIVGADGPDFRQVGAVLAGMRLPVKAP